MLPDFPQTVLLIDDDPAWTQLVQYRLAHAWSAPPVMLHTAASLETGLVVLWTQPIDLVLLDLGLPGCSDVAAVKALVQAMLQSGGLRPIVVLSAYLTDPLRRHILTLGGQESICKDDPDLWQALTAAMQRAWDRHRFQQRPQGKDPDAPA